MMAMAIIRTVTMTPTTLMNTIRATMIITVDMRISMTNIMVTIRALTATMMKRM